LSASGKVFFPNPWLIGEGSASLPLFKDRAHLRVGGLGFSLLLLPPLDATFSLVNLPISLGHVRILIGLARCGQATSYHLSTSKLTLTKGKACFASTWTSVLTLRITVFDTLPSHSSISHLLHVRILFIAKALNEMKASARWSDDRCSVIVELASPFIGWAP